MYINVCVYNHEFIPIPPIPIKLHKFLFAFPHSILILPSSTVRTLAINNINHLLIGWILQNTWSSFRITTPIPLWKTSLLKGVEDLFVALFSLSVYSIMLKGYLTFLFQCGYVIHLKYSWFHLVLFVFSLDFFFYPSSVFRVTYFQRSMSNSVYSEKCTSPSLIFSTLGSSLP